MAYCVTILGPVQKQLQALPHVIHTRIVAQAMALSNNPRPSGIKKLQGYDSTYRVRVGSYRILYEIDDSAQEVRLLRIADRKDVYR
jgi:mRNA interferase RelE/StbE